MSHEEREDNEDNGLGELPMPNRIERGENIGYSNEGTRFDRFGGKSLLDNRNYGAPYDISQENDVRSRPGEIGAVPRRFDVTSTFDARPVNGRDFLETFTLSFNINSGSGETLSGGFIVPDGYIGLVRGFRLFVSNMLNTEERLLIVSLISDGVIVNNYDNIALPRILNSVIPCYGISNALKQIGLKIAHPRSTSGSETVLIDVELYGNLLLSRGIPAQYEPANSI